MRGQAEMGVGGLISLLILIAIGAMVLYSVTGSALDTAQAQRTSITYQTANSSFTDNDSENCPAYWDNTSSARAFWNQASGYIYDNADNSTVTWYQSLVVGSLYDGISSARIAAKFKLYDNDNLTNFLAQVILERAGTENTTIWQSTSTDNSTSYTSIDNDVSAYISSAGTYRIILLDNGTGGGLSSGNTIEARWDDASLTVTMYSKGYAENAIGNVEAKGSTVFNLMTILAIVVVAALIIGVVMRAIGGAGRVPMGAPAF